MARYHRVCKGCPKHIKTNIPHKVWCSDACKDRARKARQVVTHGDR